jgi:hypothetical protein
MITSSVHTSLLCTSADLSPDALPRKQPRVIVWGRRGPFSCHTMRRPAVWFCERAPATAGTSDGIVVTGPTSTTSRRAPSRRSVVPAPPHS